MADTWILNALSNVMGTLIIDYLVKPVERRVRYLLCLNKIVEELQKQENNLSQEKTRVQADVNEARKHIETQVIEKDVEDWLKEAEKVLNDVQSLEGGIQENRRCFCWCPNWSWRYQLRKQIEQKTLAITKLVDSSKFERYGHHAELPDIEFFESEDLIYSKSSTSAFNKIMESLRDDGVNMIGVWGMGGVGKTTLVTSVGNKAKSALLFHKVIKVVVSQKPDIGKMQDKIADFLSLDFKRTTQEGKAGELWLKLEKEEKVLIILDDLWNELNLNGIGIPFHKGCRIILTTRHKRVRSKMRSQIAVQLGVLEEEEAWTLFKKNATLENASRDVIGVAKKVAKECGGLPIAIVTLAKALRDKDLNEWQLALHKLEKSRLIEIDDVQDEADKNAYLCLKASYNHLSKETTRKCLFLCALYPEDYLIPMEELVRHAWGLMLYQNADSIDEVRSEVLAAVNFLKDCCLLLEGDDKSCVKMHDVVRDVALWIASKEDNGLAMKNSRVESENEISKKKLEILLLFDDCSKISDGYFEGMQELKVLSLKKGVFKLNDGFFSLNAIKSLTNLRALQLEDFQKLEDISILAKLTKLEILNLDNCRVQESIDKLRELKHLSVLDINDCCFESDFPPKLILELVNLKEIYLHYSIRTFREANISTAISLMDLSLLPRLTTLLLEVPSLCAPQVVLPKLKRYSIAIGESLYSQYSSSWAMMSRSLRVSKELPLNVFSELFWNLEILHVSDVKEKDIKCLTDATPLNLPVATILQNLKAVRIVECKNLQVIFQMKKVENEVLLLSKLKNLHLWWLPDMEYIWKLPTQNLSLESLEVVAIYGCGKLKSLFSFSLAQSLVQLKKLKIYGCGELKQIVEELRDDEQEISPKPLCLPKLESLKIRRCDNLEYFFPNFMGRQLQKLVMANLPQLKQICRSAQEREGNGILIPQLHATLEGIQISNVKDILFVKTKNLFLERIIGGHNLIPEVDGEGLNELIFLGLEDCNSLEYLVDATKEHVPNNAFTNLVKLNIKRMEGLKMLCNGQFPKGFLQNLKELKVGECDQLLGVFRIDELFHTGEENQVPLCSNLEHLELHKLPELRWILKGLAYYFSFQSLKGVNIRTCKKLKSLFLPSFIQSLQQLETLDVKDCHELEFLFAELESEGETELNGNLHPLCLPKLRTLVVDECPKLEYVLPIPLAQSQGLPQLERVKVRNCPQLKQVFGVAKQLDENVQHSINLCSLEELELGNSTNLSSFGRQNYSVKAPVLKKLSVADCPQLMKFNIDQHVNGNRPVRFNLQGKVQLFAFKEFLRNTEHLLFNGSMDPENLQLIDEDVKRCLSQNLKELKVRNCKNLEIIEIGEPYLYNMEENQAPLLSNLEQLMLKTVTELRWIYKGPTEHVSLRSLKVVRIEECNKLEYLFSSSLIPSLRLLEQLRISNCDNLEMVFMELESEDETRTSNMPCFPNLETLEITECPRLKYVLPLASDQCLLCLQNLKLGGNLSSFGPEIYLLRAPTLKSLKVSDCTGFSNFTIQQDKPLRSKDFEECTDDAQSRNNQLNRESSPNLDYITMSDLEPLIQLSAGECKSMSSIVTISLYKLNWLRYIWKVPTQVVVTNNLSELEVRECNNLTYVFPLMLAQNLRKLEILRIWGCERLERVIVNDDTSASSSSQGHDEDEIGVKIDKEKLIFPGLKKLNLKRLPQLMSFSPMGYHLVFPSLDSLEIEGCSPMLTSFTIDSAFVVHAKT